MTEFELNLDALIDSGARSFLVLSLLLHRAIQEHVTPKQQMVYELLVRSLHFVPALEVVVREHIAKASNSIARPPQASRELDLAFPHYRCIPKAKPQTPWLPKDVEEALKFDNAYRLFLEEFLEAGKNWRPTKDQAACRPLVVS